jgi:hypothetical protein
MTEQTTPEGQATPEQMEQLRALAADTGEEVPETMRTSEASQRIVELRANS